MANPVGAASGVDLSVASDPLGDHLIRFSSVPSVAGRLLYARSREAHARALPGQDYAMLSGRADGGSLTFCVADGVGSSYYGGFAASYLTRRLVPWLQALSYIPPECAGICSALTTKLGEWAATGQRDLPPVPDYVEGGALVREVLQGLRDEYGSETVFLAGRLDLGENATDGAGVSPEATLLLCWMGNVTATLHNRTTARSLVVADDGDEARWSTGRRLRGALSMVTYQVDAYDRLIVHTDGAASLSARIATLADEELEQRAFGLRDLPASDDLTILDLVWSAGSQPSTLDSTAECQPGKDAPRG